VLKRAGRVFIPLTGVYFNDTLEAAKSLGWTHLGVVRTALKRKAARVRQLASSP
jgi:hypothetical protein